MATLDTVLLILLVLNAVGLGALVLLQQGKGADIGAAFGSGAASTVFGGSGSASFLAKLTAWLAIGFFLLSLALAFTAKERAASLLDLGLPVVTAPEEVETVLMETLPESAAIDVAVPESLTVPSEPVDSDGPDA